MRRNLFPELSKPSKKPTSSKPSKPSKPSKKPTSSKPSKPSKPSKKPTSSAATSSAAHELDAHELDAHELDAHELDAHELDAHELDAHELDAHELAPTSSADTSSADTSSADTSSAATSSAPHKSWLDNLADSLSRQIVARLGAQLAALPPGSQVDFETLMARNTPGPRASSRIIGAPSRANRDAYCPARFTTAERNAIALASQDETRWTEGRAVPLSDAIRRLALEGLRAHGFEIPD